VIVREIEERDRAEWRALFLEYGDFYKTAFDERVLDGVWGWLMDEAHEVKALVAVEDDGVIGFAIYRRLFDTFTAAPAWHLDDLYVVTNARGLGAATNLIEAVASAATAQGGGTLRWITADDNLTAQSVYNKIATRKSWVTYEKET